MRREIAKIFAGAIQDQYDLAHGVERQRGDLKFGLEEAADAFLAADKAVKHSPYKSGTIKFILGGCYLVYGERCDLQKIGHDALPALMKNYFIALNDWLNLKNRLQEEQPNGEAIRMLKENLDICRHYIDEYFQNMATRDEDQKRLRKIQELFTTAASEVTFVEETTNEAVQKISKRPLQDTPNDWRDEFETFKLRRRLVNAIEIITFIKSFVGEDLFPEDEELKNEPESIARLNKKYDWLINPNYGDAQLSDDQKRARALFFATMSAQAINNKKRYRHDATFGSWKEMTYLTEVVGLNPAEAAKIMDTEASAYATVAERHGVSPLVTAAINKAISTSLSFANMTAYDGPFSSLVEKAVKRYVNRRGGRSRQQAEVLARKEGLMFKK